MEGRRLPLSVCQQSPRRTNPLHPSGGELQGVLARDRRCRGGTARRCSSKELLAVLPAKVRESRCFGHQEH